MLLEAFLLLCIAAASSPSVQSTSSTPTHVKDLDNLILKEISDGRSCFRILSEKGTAGCAGPDDGSTWGPIQLWTGEESINDDRVVLVDVETTEEFLKKYLSSNKLKKYVKGVLIAIGRYSDHPQALSFEGKFPQEGMPSATFPYDHRLHTWNPKGNGLRWENFNIPMFLVDGKLAESIRGSSSVNAHKGFSGPLHVAELTMKMDAKDSSRKCLSDSGKCDPIGGYSVLAVTPPAKDAVKPIILIVAQMDSAGLFLEEITGADSRLSGLVAMLIVADLLKTGRSQDASTHRIAFAALNGEAWGYMGSKRMIWELSDGKKLTRGDVPFNLDHVEKIIEIGALGLSGTDKARPHIFVHQQNPTSAHQFTSSTQIKDAMLSVGGASDDVEVKEASRTNPGIPPSSLMVFLSRNTSVEGVVVAEYDKEYINPFVGSILDDDKNVNAKAIATAAGMIAKSVHRIVGHQEALEIDAEAVEDLSKQLIDCIIKPDPGLRCKLAQDISSVQQTNGLRRHYVGAFMTLNRHSQDQGLGYVANIPRFLFNFLGSRVAKGGPAEGVCDGGKKGCPDSQVCLGPVYSSKGACWTSSVYFVASYPLSLRWEEQSATSRGNRFVFLEGDDAKLLKDFQDSHGWEQEALWAESKWINTPQLKLYIREPHSKDLAVLIAGLVMLVVSIVLAAGSMAVFESRIKQA